MAPWVLLLPLFLATASFAAEGEGAKFDAALEILRKHVVSVPKPITVFHWERQDDSFSRKFDLTTPQGRSAMSRAKAASFLDSQGKHGYYFATDPVVSVSYGFDDKAENFRLVVIEINPSAKFLSVPAAPEFKSSAIDDLKMAEGNRLRTSLSRALHDESCAAYLLRGGSAPTPIVPSDDCVEMKKGLFERLGVVGVKYPWWNVKSLGESCHGADIDSFVITDVAAFEPGSLRIYTKESRDGVDERAAVSQMLNNLEPMISGADTKGPFWADLVPSSPLGERTKAWMREHLLNCQGGAEGP